MAAHWPSTHWALPAHQPAAAPTLGRAQCGTTPATPGLGALAAAAALQGPCPPSQPAALAQPPMGLPQQLTVAGQQQAAEQRRRRGCSRCVACVPHLRRHAHSLAALAARCRGSLRGPSEDGELWPGGLSSPSLYFAIRARQLQQQCRALNHAAAASLWWPAVEAPVLLLARRGAPQLRVKVPAAYTNVAPGDKCELVAIKDVVLCRPSPSPAPSAPPAAPAAGPTRATPPCLPGKVVQAPAFPASGSLPVPVTPEDAPLRPRAPSPPMAAAAPTAAPAATAAAAAVAQLAAQLLVQAAQQPCAPLQAAANTSKRTSSCVHPAEVKRARLTDAFPALSPLLPALQLTPVLDSGSSCGMAPFMFSPRGSAALHCGSLAGSAGGGSISASSSAASLVGEPSANTVLPLAQLHPPTFCSMVPTAAAPAAADQGHYLAVAQQRAASRAFTVVAVEPSPPAPPAAASLASTFLRWLRRSEL